MQPKHVFDPTRLAARALPEVRFVVDLARYQDTHSEDGGKMSDEDFVALIDVSPSLWRQTRSGRRGLSFKLLMAGGELVTHSVFEAARASLVERASVKIGRPRKRNAA